MCIEKKRRRKKGGGGRQDVWCEVSSCPFSVEFFVTGRTLTCLCFDAVRFLAISLLQ